jgi:imidazolonepropionase-like amidohydrolase
MTLISALVIHLLPAQHRVLLTHVNLIDGRGGAVVENSSILIEGDHILRIGEASPGTVPAARVIDLSGKTIMPALICAHAHVGVLRNKSVESSNYTRENIVSQLEKYARYGVSSVLCMGTDRSWIFPDFRDSSRAGQLPGARLYSAGHGFSTPGGPPGGSWTDQLYRPADPAEVPAEMDSLAALHPDMVKIWVDDFGGHAAKMSPAVYQAIIREAHRHGLRVAAHLYYLEDARKLVEAGLDVIAHSIRDQDVDDGLLKMMKEKAVSYIPTLTRDEFTYAYADQPYWLSDPFFKASLEPGVYAMVNDKAYQDKTRLSPEYATNRHAVEVAMRNLKKIFDAGILVMLGTDSGADPVRAQGFSEHRELELMVLSGLTPLQAIQAGTQNAARGLKIDGQYGTLEPGRKADFIILSSNPANDIRNTRKILAVWKDGVEINKGPLGG